MSSAIVTLQPATDEATVTPEHVAEARRALGRSLAEWRAVVGVTQADLAQRLCYSRSTVANVETGRQNVPRGFWQRADQALAARGALLAVFDAADAVTRRYQAQVAAERDRQRWADWPGQCDCGGGVVVIVVAAGETGRRPWPR